MKLSYVIVTHDRREPLLRTLAILHRSTPLPSHEWEAWVVDNASSDGTLEAVKKQFPAVRVIARPRNEGVGARSHAFAPAAGEYLVLLDDDSYPVGDAVSRSIAYMDSHRDVAAVVGRVVLPDGSLEACAMPAVMLSGAVCLRREHILRTGGFRREFFRKAGEYDVSFRLWNAGLRVERFEDVVYRHDKVLTGRSKAFAHRMDLRNNLILVSRYLPEQWRPIYRDDWTRRYAAIATRDGCGSAVRRATWEGRWWEMKERLHGRQTLGGSAFETIFEHDRQAELIADWASTHHVRRVLVADYSKTLFATWNGCRESGLRVEGVVDSNAAFAQMSYRGTPIIPDDDAPRQDVDGIVLSNVNPAQIDRRLSTLRAWFDGPVLRLWEPRHLADELRSARSLAA
jgi:GT2 family glycosyltransferase